MDDVIAAFLEKYPFATHQFTTQDVESIILDSNVNRMTQVSEIKFCHPSNNSTLFEILMNQAFKVSNRITTITSISNQILINKENVNDISLELKSFISNLPVGFYNATFDRSSLQAEYWSAGITLINHCHYSLNLSILDFACQIYKNTSMKKHCNFPLEDAYRAKTDSITKDHVLVRTLAVLIQIYENLFKKSFLKSAYTDHKNYLLQIVKQDTN